MSDEFIDEGMGRLVKVFKNIKRRLGNGKTTTHKQVYHVRKASPGDVYAQRAAAQQAAAQPTAVDHQQPDAQEVPSSSAPEPSLSYRVSVEPMEIPWDSATVNGTREGPDPIPADVRKRFDPSNKSFRPSNPIESGVPLFSVPPGEDMIWDVVEDDLLNRLRSGIITSVKQFSSANSTMLATIDSTDGNTDRAYVRFDNLSEDWIYKSYGDMYSLSKENGDLSRRSAASYELAKTCGLDDIIPPTIRRVDKNDGLETIFSVDVSDRLRAVSGITRDKLNKKLGGSAAIELAMTGAEELMNKSWEDQTEAVKAGLIRGALFDVLAWTGTRTWMEVLNCGPGRHPVILTRNDITFPDPTAMGIAFMDYRSEMASGPPAGVGYMPMLWSDLAMSLMAHGTDDDLAIYEMAAVECSKRMFGEKARDLVRALNDLSIDHAAIAGAFARAFMLRTGSVEIARNPLLIAEYYSSIITDDEFSPPFELDIESMESSIDEVMTSALVNNFSFREAVKIGGEE